MNPLESQKELSYLIPFIETNLVVTHRFIGRQVRFFENMDGELEEGFIGDYQLVNATLSRHFWNKRFFLALGAKNILDVQTIPFSGSSGSAHGSAGNSQLLNWGRTYFLRLNIELGVK